MDRQIIDIPADRRRFATIAHLPSTSRLEVGNPLVPPAGIRRFAARAALPARVIVHGIFGRPVHGALELTLADRSTVGIAIDGTSPLYIGYASHERHGGYRPADTLLLDAILPRAKLFYDIGAGWGYFTWLAATNPGFDGTVFSFEISPSRVSELEKIRTAARFANVQIMPYGLLDFDGSLAIAGGRRGLISRLVPAASRGTSEASVRRLDNLGLPAPDLIRISAGDHVRSALEGGSATIRTHRPAILFECRADLDDDAAILFDMLRSNEYLIYSVAPSATGVTLTRIDTMRPMTIPGPASLFAAPRSRLSVFMPA